MENEEQEKPRWHNDVAKLDLVPLEPSSFCEIHGRQAGAGCSECWDKENTTSTPEPQQEQPQQSNWGQPQ